MADSNMPTTYETKTTTSTSGTSFGLHPEYLRTIPGILKIVEIVLDLITFICAIVTKWPGAGWVDFVAMSAFITTLIFFIFYLTGIYGKLPGPWMLIEFIYYCVFTAFYLIAACVCASKGAYHASIGAAAFFAFAATAVYAVDTFFQFRAWRTGQNDTTQTTTTTTTSASVEQGHATY